MFKLDSKMWQTDNSNFLDVFTNAYLLREKQFKIWWTPYFPRVNIVTRIQDWMVQTLDIVKTYKKYYH